MVAPWVMCLQAAAVLELLFLVAAGSCRHLSLRLLVTAALMDEVLMLLLLLVLCWAPQSAAAPAPAPAFAPAAAVVSPDLVVWAAGVLLAWSTCRLGMSGVQGTPCCSCRSGCCQTGSRAHWPHNHFQAHHHNPASQPHRTGLGTPHQRMPQRLRLASCNPHS